MNEVGVESIDDDPTEDIVEDSNTEANENIKTNAKHTELDRESPQTIRGEEESMIEVGVINECVDVDNNDTTEDKQGTTPGAGNPSTKTAGLRLRNTKT